MSIIIKSVLVSILLQPQIVEGDATFYNPGVMESVAVYRGFIGSADDYQLWLDDNGLTGAVALNRCTDLYRTVYLVSPDGVVEGPYLSIDCAAAHDLQLRLSQGRVVEVDYQTAERWGMNRPVPVKVLFFNPFDSICNDYLSAECNVTR